MRIRQKLLFFLSIPMLALGLTSLGRAANSFRMDYHWTPGYHPLDERQGRFEVYVRGRLLDQALRDAQLAVRSGDHWESLNQSDVTVRLNQIDRVTRGPLLIGVGCLSAALAWICAVFTLGRANTQQ